MESPRWHVCATTTEVHERVIAWIASAAAEAIVMRGVFHIVLAGGETFRAIYDGLRSVAIDWDAWRVYFGDERCLPGDDLRRNSRMVEVTLLMHVPIPDDQIHVIRSELGAQNAAMEYCATLAQVPEFDLVLLGLGEDGHTASLFPGMDWGEGPGAQDALAVYGAPKPPAERVSLSAIRLSRTRNALFVVTGSGKRNAVQAWGMDQKLPASAIRPLTGVDVVLDRSCFGS